MGRASKSAERISDYRRSEKRLWDQHGLEVSERMVELDSPEVTLRITEVGNGPPALFIPGAGGTGPYWARLVEHLKDRRCLLLDRPGWGFSSPIRYHDHDYKQLASRVIAGVFKAYGIESAPVVGASIGNAWALAAASDNPGIVERVVLLGGGPLSDKIEVSTFIKLLKSPIGALMVKIPMNEKMFHKQMSGVGHPDSVESGAITHEYVAWRIALNNGTDSMKHEREMAQAIHTRDGYTTSFTGSELSAVRQPVLMVIGSSDPIGSPQIWGDFIARFPNGRMSLVEGTGHIPWIDKPAEVGGQVAEFLSKR